MPIEIRTITQRGRLFSVNCYLLRGGAGGGSVGGGFVLVDTGLSSRRAELDRELEAAGCGAHDLRLIVITHGDADHAGNAAHLRRTRGAPIAMHRAEWTAVEKGHMLLNRGRMTLLRRVIGSVVFRFGGLGRDDRFAPDVALEDGAELSGFGLDARVLHLPGHSQGSVAVLTADGDLFCGDLLTSLGGEPKPNSLVDDPAQLAASVARVRSLGVRTVHPGHGRPFALEELQAGTG